MQPQTNSLSQQVKPQQITKFGPFSVFTIIKKSHNNYGIKNTDYQRYRNYCTRKIRKIRKSINYKLGTKNKFLRKDIVKDNQNDKKILEIALLSSQKYWAQANETKYSPRRNPAHKARARFVSIKKLKRAIIWSNSLCKITTERSTYLTTLQSNAYKFYLQGMLAFEQQVWSQAQTKLIAARQIMEELMKSSTSISAEIFKEKMDQFDQTIKFCNFKISKGKDMPISEIIQMKKMGDPTLSTLIQNLTQQRLNEISLQQNIGLNEIKFGEERYPIKEQALKLQKSKIDSQAKMLEQVKSKVLSNINSTDQTLYQELLLLYSSVVVLVQQGITLTEKQIHSKKDKYNQAQLQVLKKISLLFQQTKLSLFIDRSYTIFKYSYNTNKDRKSSPQTLAKLLTTVSNNFLQLSELVKEKHLLTATSPMEELKAIEEKSFYLRNLRLLFVGQVYFNNDKIKEAYGLWSECEKSVRTLLSKEQMKSEKQKAEQAKDSLRCNLVPLQKIQQQVKQSKLKCVIKNYKSQAKTKTQLTKMVDQVNVNSNKPKQTLTLEELLNSEPAQLNISLEKLSQIQIIKLPGSLEPVITRPIFFDIYQTQLQYPNLDSKVKKSKGFFGGFFGKWNK